MSDSNNEQQRTCGAANLCKQPLSYFLSCSFLFFFPSDTYWQTESGGILLSPLPGATTLKPGSATFPFFGVEPALLDPVSHKELPQTLGEETTGALVVKRSWPGIARTVLGDHERYKTTYFPSKEQPEFYVTGDSARRDADGYWSAATAMHEFSQQACQGLLFCSC